jgi:hypothetical protein
MSTPLIEFPYKRWPPSRPKCLAPVAANVVGFPAEEMMVAIDDLGERIFLPFSSLVDTAP